MTDLIDLKLNVDYVIEHVEVRPLPQQRWRIRTFTIATLLLGYVGGVLLSFWYAGLIFAGASADGVDQSTARLAAGIPAVAIYGVCIALTLYALLWAWGSDGRVARWLRDE